MESHKENGVHISHQPFTWRNWHQHVNWLNTFFIILLPLAGCIAAYFTPLQPLTAVWAIIYYFWTGLGITAGYHRLWSHRSYSASLPLQLFLAAGGAGAVEGSIRWWSRGHRAHHRYTDTVKDPYSVRKGLLYSHLGWMVLYQDPKQKGRTDISDLNADPLVVWQHRNYLPLVLTFALALPTLVAGLGWNDWVGGFIYAGILRVFFVQQATFCINSLAHWLGDQPFDDKNSPRDNFITALLTLGEGYHNFHHEFPSDFRNGLFWYQYDPTKWCIVMWKWLGLAYDLKTFPSNEIQKGQVQQLQKKLDRQRAALHWGVPIEQLPTMEWDDFVSQSQLQDRALIAIAGVVHDLTDFINEHPGGKALITSAIGKDATSMFNGGVYEHSNAAHNLLSYYRVGVIRGGGEVEIWRSPKNIGVSLLRRGIVRLDIVRRRLRNTVATTLTRAITGLKASDHKILLRKQTWLQQYSLEVPSLFARHAGALDATLVFAQEEAGTAVCISPNGILLTCSHCVAENSAEWEESGESWLLFKSGLAVKARCVAWDERRDLALLQVVVVAAAAQRESESSGGGMSRFPSVAISRTPPALNSRLVCVGHPGSEDLEASRPGIKTNYDVLHVSAGRFRGCADGQDPQDNSAIGALMHDCWTYWGHSGAPLLDVKTGGLVGLHSSWDDETGMRRGIPLEAILEFLGQHREHVPFIIEQMKH